MIEERDQQVNTVVCLELGILWSRTVPIIADVLHQLGVRPAGGRLANDFLFPILVVDTSCHDLREDVLIDVNLRQDLHLLFFLWF